MEAKWTPGPWRVNKDWPWGPSPILADSYTKIFEACIEGPYGDAALDWHNEHDMRLIAAAPELAALLERWVNEHMHKEHPALTDATLAILNRIKGA